MGAVVTAVGCRARTRPAIATVLELIAGQEEILRSIWEVDGGLVTELGEWDQAIHSVGRHASDVCARDNAELGGGVCVEGCAMGGGSRRASRGWRICAVRVLFSSVGGGEPWS